MCTIVKIITQPFARTETEKQVKGQSKAEFRGYTAAEGGLDAAERGYEEHVRNKQTVSVVYRGQEDVNEKQDAMITSGKEGETPLLF